MLVSLFCYTITSLLYLQENNISCYHLGEVQRNTFHALNRKLPINPTGCTCGHGIWCECQTGLGGRKTATTQVSVPTDCTGLQRWHSRSSTTAPAVHQHTAKTVTVTAWRMRVTISCSVQNLRASNTESCNLPRQLFGVVTLLL